MSGLHPGCTVLGLALLAGGGAPAVASEPTDAQRIERLRRELDLRRQREQIPGMAVAVVRGDEVVWAEGFGVSDLASGRPVTTRTVFGVGSAGKSFTAVLVAMLAEEGLLSFSDSVSRHVPEFTPSDPRAARSMTLSDLLSHRTGYARMTMLFVGRLDQAEEILPYASRAELWKPFRQSFHYANVNFVLAGIAAGRAAESEWSTLVEERLFRSLGMRSSFATHAASLAAEDRATGYAVDRSRRETRPQPPVTSPAIGAAGTIHSNVDDMTRWLRFLVGRGSVGGRELLPEDEFERLWSPAVSMGQVAYGLGFMIGDWRGDRVIFHPGNFNGYSSVVALQPEEDLGFVLLCNSFTTPLQGAAADLAWDCLLGDWDAALLDAPPAPEPARPDPRQLLRYEGAYESAVLAMTAEVLDGRLTVDVPGEMVHVLQFPDADGRWRFEAADGVAVSFDQEGELPAKAMTFHQPGAAIEMDRLIPDPALPALEDVLRPRLRRLPVDPFATHGAVLLEGKVELTTQGLDGDYRFLLGDLDHQHLRMDLPPVTRVVRAIDGDAAWAMVAPRAPRALPPERRDEEKRFGAAAFFGDLREVYPHLRVIAEDEVGGERAWVLTARGETGLSTRLWLSVETGLLLKERVLRTNGVLGTFPTTTTYRDHRDVGGIWIAHRMLSENPNSGRQRITILEVTLGAERSPGAFGIDGER